jgi:uncharacterized protein
MHRTKQQSKVLPSTHPWFHEALIVASSQISGIGIFTVRPIHVGEIVMIWGGRLFTRAEVKLGRAKPHSLSGYDEHRYLGHSLEDPDSIDYFLNHSCDPNLWMLDEITIAARRDISSGEELTADYACWEIDIDWRLEPCTCRSKLCRRTVTGKDWANEDLQRRYEWHFLPCLRTRIRTLETRKTYSPTLKAQQESEASP